MVRGFGIESAESNGRGGARCRKLRVKESEAARLGLTSACGLLRWSLLQAAAVGSAEAL